MVHNIKRILIVEDNAIAALSAKRIFEKLGCQVEHVDNGETAIQLVKDRNFDGICMDIGLPTISGTETCKVIRDHEALNQLKPIPIVAVTGNYSPEEMKSYLKAGMQEVIKKPLTKEMAEHFLSFCK
ncbi:MAG: response regulator [Tatlockia sp.]|nr:response regulator [Tatlockia sp.]